MIQETVLSGTQIIDAFRKEFTNLKTLCLHCHVTDVDGLEKLEKLTTRRSCSAGTRRLKRGWRRESERKVQRRERNPSP